MMGTRVCRNRMGSGLPNASGKIESSLGMWYAIPVENELVKISGNAELASRENLTYATITYGFFMSFLVRLV